MVYELAVAVEEPINPWQVESRSNMFLCKFVTTSGTEFRLVPAPQIHRICRKIYDDVRERHPFYRVNEFKFDTMDHLHVFLAAITPTRRRMICNITLERSPDMHTVVDPTWSPIHLPKHRHAVSLLYQCSSLQKLHVIADVGHPNLRREHPMAACQRNMNQALVKHFKYTFHPSSLWNFSTFSLSIKCEGSQRFQIEMGKKSTYIELGTNFRQYPDTLLTALRLNFMLIVYKVVHGTIEVHEGLLGSDAKQSLLREAITAAKLDFPGEDRITQDMSNSSSGTIATRTRQRCSTNTTSRMGTLNPRGFRKYTADGSIQGFIEIHQVRWSNENIIECDIEWGNPEPTHYDVSQPNIDIGPCNAIQESERPRSWEPLECMLGYRSLRALEKFYRARIDRERREFYDPMVQLDRIKAMPDPKDIVVIANGILKLEDLSKRERKSYTNDWIRLHGDWCKLVLALEKLVENQKKAAERQQKAAARQEKAAARQQKIAARQGNSSSVGK